ncbi:MAG: LacI family DNA-binding transcriptional regulator [Piscinibacter sp.]|nr:LacI family DNA-binding transcriptional regulator [Piscinibacter sp.]
MTLADVARRAGVGLGTASRAISGQGSVAPETLARVQQAAAALGFQPSKVARALSRRTSDMVGIYVPDFSGDFYGPILQMVDAELRAVDRHMVAANGCGGGDRRQQALDGIRFLQERQCDGVLVMSNALRDTDYAALWKKLPRMVLLNRRSPAHPENCFGTDHRRAGRLAARALLSRGHRDIACIGGPHSAPDNEDRMAGFHAELAAHGVQVPPERQVEGDFGLAGGQAAADELLRRGPRGYTALFCANDMMAMAAVSRFGAAGVRVPQDLAVLGYDDSALAAFTTPALTTVRVPIRAAAESGCRFLINLCYGLALPVQRDFPPEVVWRDSVAAGPHEPITFDDDTP